MEKANKNSSLELLRIFSIIGIVCMHSLAPIWTNPRFIPLSAAENSIFNIGVTCFILISGYFGIRFSIRKWFYLEVIAIFGGIITVVEIVRGGGVSLSLIC